MAEAWPDIAGRIEGAGHVLPVRVYYEDTDFTGHVYHAAYLRFCERGRSDFLRLTGIGHSELLAGVPADEALYFAVRRMELDFLKAAGIDDLLEVHTRFAAMTRAKLVVDQEIVRGETPLFRARVTVALLGPGGRPRRLATALGDRLRPLLQEGTADGASH
jgi:acyl-CoA thioester hydrolase